MDCFDRATAFISGFVIPTLLLKRRVHFPGKRGRETLAEHLVQLLYFAEFFVHYFSLSYDMNKIRIYIIAHDMSEPATGHAKKTGYDICRFNATPELIRDKRKLEAQALQLQRRQFPELTELVTAAEKYEEQLDNESRFVRALDALLPMLTVVMDNGRTFWNDGITLEMWRKDREPRIRPDRYLWSCYESEILPVILAREQELFPKPNQLMLAL
jgi:hypothetical protein